MTTGRRLRVRPTRGGLVLAVIATGLFAVAQTTGAGWLTIQVSVLAGVLIVGAVWPIVHSRGLSVDVTAPTDGTVGIPVSLRVEATTHMGPFRLSVVEPTTDRISVQSSGIGTIEAVPVQRGILQSLLVDVWTAAPFGLVSVTRHLEVPLGEPMAVGPKPEPMSLPPETDSLERGYASRGRRRDYGDAVRSVREYSSGDPLRLVHWRASARSTELLVKELEAPERPHLIVILDLTGAPEPAEFAASRAAGLIQTARHAGISVTLVTCEAEGTVVGDVGSSREAGRRLARATSGHPTVPEVTGRATVARISAADGGAS